MSADRVANVALVRALQLAEDTGMDTRALALELSTGATTLYARREGDRVVLYIKGATETTLGSVHVGLLAAQFAEPTAN